MCFFNFYFVYSWERSLRNMEKLVKNRLCQSRSILDLEASKKGIQTKISTMFKNVVWNRFSTKTSGFHFKWGIFNLETYFAGL